jgi:hypothetical protein
LWTEVDIQGPGHAEQALPASLDEALELAYSISELPPSLIIHSGGGIYAFWLFKEPWILESKAEQEEAQGILKRFERTIQIQANAKGWNLDSVADLRRVLRLPGSTNIKDPDNPKPVKVLEHHSERRYNPEDFEPYLAELESTVIHGSLPTDEDFEPADLEKILSACAWMKHCRDDAAQLKEPEWYRMLSVVARCKDPQWWAHELSRPYPGYSEADTAQKLQQAKDRAGPVTCERVRKEINPEICKGCKESVTSPIQLGRREIEQAQPEQPQASKPDPPKELDLSKALVDAEHFLEIPIQPKTIYLNPWVTSSQVILISAWRNLGKTMFAMSMLDSITKGLSFGPWTCELPATCLYMDGEMVADDVIDRLKGFGLGNRYNPLLIYSDFYANTLGFPRANLLDEKWRAAMQKLLIQNNVKIWVVDNLASLTPGADENVKSEWDPVNQWFLELRFQGITSVLVHHTGKGGTQRGTSAREDNIDISISLERPANYHTEDGARFICKFPKARIKSKDLPYVKDYEFQLKEVDGRYEWLFKDEQADKKQRVLSMLDQGFKQKDIAEELGMSSANVTKIKNRAVTDGILSKDGRLTQSGYQKIHG